MTGLRIAAGKRQAFGPLTAEARFHLTFPQQDCIRSGKVSLHMNEICCLRMDLNNREAGRRV